MKRKVSGLYAVTPDGLSTEALLEKVSQALAGGARIVQYRQKSGDAITHLSQADPLAALVKARQAIFIVNDAPALARSVNADGVHLGLLDADVAAARALLPDKLIGVSCYDDLERAVAAEKAGADYVAFGAAFPSLTKPAAAHASAALYREAKQRLSIPIVAIGGITVANAGALIDAGVAAVAVVSALFDAEDIAATAKQFSDLFHKAS